MDLAVGLKKVKLPCETARAAAAVGSAGAPAARVLPGPSRRGASGS